MVPVRHLTRVRRPFAEIGVAGVVDSSRVLLRSAGCVGEGTASDRVGLIPGRQAVENRLSPLSERAGRLDSRSSCPGGHAGSRWAGSERSMPRNPAFGRRGNHLPVNLKSGKPELGFRMGEQSANAEPAGAELDRLFVGDLSLPDVAQEC